MKKYIFVTAEGFTYQPESESIMPDTSPLTRSDPPSLIKTDPLAF